MAMETIQIRLTKGMVHELDECVKEGLYSNKSDVVRDAIRFLALKRAIGSVKNRGDAVKQVREIRKKLTEKDFDLDEINNL